MRHVLRTALLVASCLSSLDARSATRLGGIISTTTKLTLAESPYVLTKDVQIAYGATLAIEPGVAIDGAGHAIVTYGNLSAIGSEAHPIAVRDCKLAPGKSPKEEPFTIWIEHATIAGGSVWSSTGNGGSGSLVLRDSRLSGTDHSYIHYPVADCFIERNVFVSCGGLSVGVADGSKVSIVNNVFYDSRGRSRQPRDPAERFAIEVWAAFRGGVVLVAGNSFLSTDRPAVVLPSGYESTHVSAEHNFWNTTDAATIDGMIFDRKDDLGSNDVIAYMPFLGKPDPATPDPAAWIPQG